MSVPLVVNGVTFNYPVQGDGNWGPVLTAWSTAITNIVVPLTGGVLTLTPYPNSGVNFANSTNSGYLSLTVNSSNQLTFNGTPIGTAAALTNSHIFVGNISNQPSDVAMSGDATIANTGAVTISALAVTHGKLAANAVTDVNVAAGAAIDVSKLGALTASSALETDGSGVITTSAVTATELGYLSGVTSALQAQLNAITNLVIPIGGSFAYSSSTPPSSNFVLKDGRAISRTAYSTLFALIGVTFGPGDGSTTFNIPNATDRISIAAGNLYTLGQIGGSPTHTLTTAELPNQTYNATSTPTDPGHNHTLRGSNTGGASQIQLGDTNANAVAALLSSTGGGAYTNAGAGSPGSGLPYVHSATTGITVATSVSDTNGNGAHSILNPYLAEYWMYRII